MNGFVFDIKEGIGIKLIGSKAINVMKTTLATGRVRQRRQADGLQCYSSTFAAKK